MSIPFLCVFLAFVLVYVPKLVMAKGQAARPEGYDNALPRDQQAKLDGIARRAVAAHQNGFEGFAPFAAAVLCAQAAQVRPELLNALSMTYVTMRVVYIGLYLADRSTLRSIVWTIGFGTTAMLFVLASLGG
jgi:uncharacterized MAPEG superfamily protein